MRSCQIEFANDADAVRYGKPSKLDREALQALLLSEHQERIATQEKLQRRETEIEHLKLLLSQLRRMQFGRKSEKLERQIEQLELRLEDLQQAQAAEQTTQSIERPSNEPSQPTTQAKPARRPLPEHLPRQTQTRVGQHRNRKCESLSN